MIACTVDIYWFETIINEIWATIENCTYLSYDESAVPPENLVEDLVVKRQATPAAR